MADDPRFVLDSNVIVSALLLPSSIPRRAFDRAVEHGKLLSSSATVAEINDVLRRPGFARYLLEEERSEFVSALVRDALLIDVNVTVTECRDAKDNKFLELAVSGIASCIVSGDDDLLVLDPFRGIPILTPRSFLDWSW